MQLSQCLSRRPLNEQCLNLMERFVGLSLGLGLLCIWWNPKWQHKLSNKEGKLGGLEKYYLIQLGLLLSRLTVWAVLQHVPLDVRTTNLIHALFAVAITAVALLSNLKIIQIRLLQPIDWNVDPAPLLSSQQFIPPESSVMSRLAPNQDRAFSLQNLASTTAQSYETWRPPTPPTESEELMDWTPSQPAFQPLPRTIHYLPTGPSPFHGKLPAIPTGGFQRESRHLPQAPKEAIGLPPGYFDRKPGSILPPRQQRVSDDAIAQPTFFGHDRQADTGLESIFETVFSFKDRAAEASVETSRPSVQSGLHRAPQSHRPNTAVSVTPQNVSFQMIISGVAFFSLLVALVTWLLEIAVEPEGSTFGYYIVLASASIPAIHLFGNIVTGRLHGHFLWLIVFTIEASSLVALALMRDMLEVGFRDLWNKLAIAAVALLLPQEFVGMSSVRRASDSKSQSTRPLPPREVARDNAARNLVDNSVIDDLQVTSTPKPRRNFVRQDSDEFTDVQTPATSSSTKRSWDSPNVQSDRYQWEPPENLNRPATRSSSRPFTRKQSSGVTNGFVGLSLDDIASRNTGPQTESPFGNAWSSSSGSLDSEYRDRRRF